MKKFFKFGCLGIIGFIVLIIILAIAFSGDDDKPSTGSSSNNSKNEKSVNGGTKKVDVSDHSTEQLGMKVGLGELKVATDKIQIGINIENTTDKPISFYPDQGSAVIGDMQLDANMFLTDGEISGDIQGCFKKEAVLEFLVPDGKKIDVDTLKEVKFMFGDVYSEESFDTKDISFTVPIK
ncbi:hypothetical protein SB775_26885 [Peribacillus sp. SIMBA_075]|uniref:hypothetical protein n=1 Tax=Peribacillus sp. SIMBA_075 TaxID=3085813 RepID=UPI00397BE31D